ncbi:MAG: hypothetical protein IPM98_04660 [Lewinellaceae bacterium]|nr:hypothetical protein [Lewinellaceae bacterium]
MLTVADRQFIQKHLNDDLHRLLLSAHRYPGVSVPAAVGQIEALRKVHSKIPAWYNTGLEFPPGLSVEQASSEQTARFKAGLFSGKTMADLTGGMGVDTYFFAQRFEQVTYVEHNPELVALARHNFGVLGAANITAIQTDAETFLNHNTAHFDLLYLDPARRDGGHRRLFRLEDCAPNILEIKEKLLETADRVLIKTAPLLDLNQATGLLQSVSHIWVVSVDNEVKEVLYLLEKSAPAFDQVPIEAVCIGETLRVFRHTRLEEQATESRYAAPQGYLYEPDAAVLKAGAFRAFAAQLGLWKLHANTHLYTSGELVPNVPGRMFSVEAVLRYDRREVQRFLPEGRANIAVRNFPDSTEQVRQRLGLADGGEWYIFGATDMAEHKILIVCRKVSGFC